MFGRKEELEKIILFWWNMCVYIYIIVYVYVHVGSYEGAFSYVPHRKHGSCGLIQSMYPNRRLTC